MRKVISFLIFAVACALLISCGGTHKCYSSTEKETNPSLTEVTLHQTEVTQLLSTTKPETVLSNYR